MPLNKLELSTILTVSTAHLTQETLTMLDEMDAWDPTFANIACYPKLLNGENIGWFIYTCVPSSQIKEEVPNDLRTLLDLAEFCNAGIICVDRDGPVIKDIPKPYTYDA